MVWILPILIALSLSLSSCYSLGYYAHSFSGQMELIMRRQPIREVVAAPQTPDDVKQKLNAVLQVRAYATGALGLPDNESYLSYSSIDRKFVVWNVFATPEFSLAPLQWCFPIAGCNGYVGFFSEARARNSASQLADRGNDVYVGGVAAYSTLGWFADPVLSTMLNWDRAQLASFVIHELAHQMLYVPDDSKFNEAFATTVAKLGVQQWLAAGHDVHALRDFKTQESREQQFVELILSTREQLQVVYSQPLTLAAKRAEKRRILNDLHTRYAELRDSWGGYHGYDSWVHSGVNNAKISSVVTYHQYETAFESLFRYAGNSFPRFYGLAAALGNAGTQARAQCLADLAAGREVGVLNCPRKVVGNLFRGRALVQQDPSVRHQGKLM